MALKPITELVSETEIRENLRKAFAASTCPGTSSTAIADLGFWENELRIAGKSEIYNEERRRHQRAIRGITDL